MRYLVSWKEKGWDGTQVVARFDGNYWSNLAEAHRDWASKLGRWYFDLSLTTVSENQMRRFRHQRLIKMNAEKV